MTDLLAGRATLADFKGFAACGGFSYGDVLGGGGGWAKTILHNPKLAEEFAAFFLRGDSFALGVCKRLPDDEPAVDDDSRRAVLAALHPQRSEQFEGRLVMAEVLESPSLFFAGMAGSRMPIANAHGEGFAAFSRPEHRAHAEGERLVAVRYVDSEGRATERYPYNPNGSPGGITGLTTPDGRFTILMPHPERVRRTVQMSWQPPGLARTRRGCGCSATRGAGSADAGCSGTDRKGRRGALCLSNPESGLLDLGGLAQLVGVGGHLLLLQRFADLRRDLLQRRELRVSRVVDLDHVPAELRLHRCVGHLALV